MDVELYFTVNYYKKDFIYLYDDNGQNSVDYYTNHLSLKLKHIKTAV